MSIILRDNSETEDARLNRIQWFDEKSRNFSIAEVTQDKPFRSYTWRCNQWYDQGTEGACVAFSLGHELSARPSEVAKLEAKWLVEQIYWEAQKIDPWAGGSYPGAYPFYEGTAVLAGVKVLHKLGYFESYRWAFSTDDAIRGIGYNGPCVIGVNWYSGMLDTDSNGYIRPIGSVVGGHAILVNKVNVKEEYVQVHNSWGRSWGVNGTAKITFADFDKLLQEYGEAVFLLQRHKLPRPK